MTALLSDLQNLNTNFTNNEEAFNTIAAYIAEAGYEIVESNTTKPWGAYFRINSAQAEAFIADFFHDLTIEEARLGIENAEVSPKILAVLPSQRLSWQYHDRRAERWRFLTQGGYRRSESDEQGERLDAQVDEVVQFKTGERHRLEGRDDGLVLVAEIWQHSDSSNISDEDDIVRLEDDYRR